MEFYKLSESSFKPEETELTNVPREREREIKKNWTVLMTKILNRAFVVFY